MGMLNIIAIVVSLLPLLAPTYAKIPGVYSGGPWQSAHATFYGGSDASGTMGMHTIVQSNIYATVKFCIFHDDVPY